MTKTKPQSASNHPLFSGVELMQQLNDGAIGKVALEYVSTVRTEVSEALDELLDVGARIRPLLSDGKQVGWIRGLHFAERKVILRYYRDRNEQILHTIAAGTTLTHDEILACTPTEIQGLSRVLNEMSDRDISLFPFLSAFCTTSASESLWHSSGRLLGQKREIHLPDGKLFRLVSPSEHSRLWVSLNVLREQSKMRLDAQFNAAMIVRSNVGKAANSIVADLKAIAKSLQADAIEPWESIVRREVISRDDGWAHTSNSVDELREEMDKMILGDRHEKVIELFHERQLKEAEAQEQKLHDLLEKRIPELEAENIEVIGDNELRKRQQAIRRGQPLPKAPDRPEERDGTDTASVHEKLKKYR